MVHYAPVPLTHDRRGKGSEDEGGGTDEMADAPALVGVLGFPEVIFHTPSATEHMKDLPGDEPRNGMAGKPRPRDEGRRMGDRSDGRQSNIGGTLGRQRAQDRAKGHSNKADMMFPVAKIRPVD